MKSLLAFLLLGASSLTSANAQTNTIPPPALAAKTVVILNDTHTSTVEDGATEELKEWGHLKVIDDVDSADIVLLFSKKGEHDRTNTQTADPDGKSTSYGFNITSDSTIHMTATIKNGFTPFYSTESKDSKRKAGKECAQAFINALQDAQRQHASH